ncbi:hypothetical protein ACIRPX_22935 [Streptomyces sp. NPDC101225]|uniref:hypothetical protein n=1 Tax=Streptomyces sp. NPDC101225 TaxID=3366135 RepID=UPI00380E79BB
MPDGTRPWRTPRLWVGLGGAALLSAAVLKGVIEGNGNARIEGVMLLVVWSFLAGLVIGHRSGVRRVLAQDGVTDADGASRPTRQG